MALSSLLRPLRRQPIGVSLALSAVIVGSLVTEVWHLARRTPTRISDPRYLVAARDLEQGQALGLRDFTVATARELGTVPDGALTDQDIELLRDARLEIPLTVGQVLTLRGLRPLARELRRSAIPRGHFAYGFRPFHPVSVRTGDRVDVLLSPESRNRSPETLVENALVLQADRLSDDDEMALVIALRREEMESLEKAQRQGKLRIALRSPQDDAIRSRPKARRRRPRLSHRRQSIEILGEGE